MMWRMRQRWLGQYYVYAVPFMFELGRKIPKSTTSLFVNLHYVLIFCFFFKYLNLEKTRYNGNGG